MNLTLTRKKLTSESTEGELWADGEFVCFSLELPVEEGLPGSAIPPGKYSVIVTWSPKFGQDMPLLLGIPGRTDIRIHWGNLPSETLGCILVGTSEGTNFISESRIAFAKVWSLIEAPARAGGCTITVA